MQISVLRNNLASLLSNDLGKFPNGLPAVWVTPPEPPGLADSKIQCIVQRVPEAKISNLTSGQRYLDRDYVIILTSLDKSISLSGSLDKIIQRFFVRRVVYSPLTEQSFEQARIMICDPIIVNGV